MHPFYSPSSQLLQEGYWFAGLVSMALYLIFWAIVVIIAYRLVKRHFINQGGFWIKQDNAMSILRERYAKGEISAEEFKRVKSDLEEK